MACSIPIVPCPREVAQRHIYAPIFGRDAFFSTNIAVIPNGTMADDPSCESPSFLRDQIRSVPNGTTNTADEQSVDPVPPPILEHIAWGVLLTITVAVAIFGVSVGLAAQ